MLVYDPTKENFDFFSGDYSLRTYSSKKTHPIVSMLAEQGYSVQADRCRPVEVDPDHPVGLTPVSLIYSSTKSWAVSGWANRKFPPEKNPLLDVQGPIPIASVSSYADEDGKPEAFFPKGELRSLVAPKSFPTSD